MWMYVCPPQPAAAAVSAAGVGASAAAGAEGGARGRTRTRQRDVDADGDVRMPDAREQAAEEVGEEEVGWRMVYPGHAHPDMEGYVLHLLDDGTPRWVKESSAKTYECGRKLRRRLERYSEC
ncbi:hypothetical protein ONZ51_g777 [Trametes cubensis]|uniref:Uncharacterized protein n=1 Tax=Trametes cubensis TaxID=1111947 RepID=A0AAD7U422_9APHY|nr:hypothetical protein ONZ51_g777 [Trametes cubensis]